ncbi:MAG: AI-2E family transporter, partial [Saprospiraceae bacterium]
MTKHNAILRPLLVLLLITAMTIVLFYGRSFLVPLAYGAMFAFLLNPIDQKLRSFNLNKYATGILSVSVLVLVIFILLSVFGWQVQQLSEQSDKIEQQLVEKQGQLQGFIKSQFGISWSKQEDYAEKFVESMRSNVGSFLGGGMSILSSFFLSLIYAILLLTEKKRIRKFFLNHWESNDQTEKTIEDTSDVIQSYLIGKLMIIAALAVIYAIGFSIVGIQYAILIAVLAAFLTFIPYVGNIIGCLLAALITLATGGSTTDIFILLGIMAVAQVIESYVLAPWIVGGKIDLNPLFS